MNRPKGGLASSNHDWQNPRDIIIFQECLSFSSSALTDIHSTLYSSSSRTQLSILCLCLLACIASTLMPLLVAPRLSASLQMLQQTSLPFALPSVLLVQVKGQTETGLASDDLR